jgi:hypothetical protein
LGPFHTTNLTYDKDVIIREIPGRWGRAKGRTTGAKAVGDTATPLTSGAAGEIGSAMGWSHPYRIGVLSGWKLARTYCEAVLSHDQRIALDGAPAEPVDAEAKEMAAKRLATLAARVAAKGSERQRNPRNQKVTGSTPADVEPVAAPPALIDSQ